MAKEKINKNDLMLQLFVVIDDLMKLLPRLPKPHQKGRKRKMSPSEIVTAMVFGITAGLKNMSDIHRELTSYFSTLFDVPCYKNFVCNANEDAREALLLLCAIIEMNRRMSGGRKKFIDATCVAVCKNKRIFNHKVAKGFAQRGMSTMGRFYGFKLHIIVDERGNLVSFSITPGNTDDRKVVKKMVKKLTGIIVADAGYISKKLGYELHGLGITFLTAYKKNMKKLVTKGFIKLLKCRQIVETGFGMMKCGGNLVSSYARSIGGHLARVINNLLQYSVKKLESINHQVS